MKKKWYSYFVVSDAPSVEPGPPRPREARRAADAVSDIDADVVFTAPVADPTAFEEIYAAAQIATPEHAYTVLKVAEMLQSEHIRDMPPDVKRKSVLVALDAADVTVEAIVQDAVARDRALDTYERVLQKHLEDLRAAKDAENRRLETELNERIRELRARIETNEQEVSKEQNQLLAWRAQKQREEDRIAEAVSYFVSENPITTVTPFPDNKGGSPNVR